MTDPSAAGRSKHTVLFVCEDNARRSLVAEALFRDGAGPHLRVFSAGLAPADRADTYTLSVLALAGLGPDGLWPKPLDGFCDRDRPLMNTVVTIGAEIAGRLPRILPGTPEYRTWRLPAGRNVGSRHNGAWRDLQVLRPLVMDLIEELRAGGADGSPALAATPAE